MMELQGSLEVDPLQLAHWHLPLETYKFQLSFFFTKRGEKTRWW